MQIFGASGTNALIDTNEVVLSGHSFGGTTMIALANELEIAEQPKALLLLDPWFYPIFDDVKNLRTRF